MTNLIAAVHPTLAGHRSAGPDAPVAAAQGMNNALISKRLSIGPRTAEMHRANLRLE